MMKYSRDEVFNKTKDYFNGGELEANVWINKYALKDEDYLYELTPDDMHKRIAKELARIENNYINPVSENEIYELIKDFKYIVPQGGPMSGIGNTRQTVSLSNCFVVGNEADSYGGIFQVDQEQAQLMKRRGGVGHDLSHIRSKGTNVKNSALTSTGVYPFMERFSNTTREVAQDGRRGALMLTCFTPDTFVLIKDGWQQISKVVERLKNGEKIKAWTHEGYKEITNYQEFDEQDIYEIETKNGKKIKVTANHEFEVRNTKTNKEYLKAIKDVDINNEELIFYE